MTTNYEAYQHAIERLTVAAAALDQAIASMQDARISMEITTPGWRGMADISIIADGLADALKHADCEECGHALSMHGGKYGCDYEYCACKWGQQEAKH